MEVVGCEPSTALDRGVLLEPAAAILRIVTLQQGSALPQVAAFLKAASGVSQVV